MTELGLHGMGNRCRASTRGGFSSSGGKWRDGVLMECRDLDQKW